MERAKIKSTKSVAVKEQSRSLGAGAERKRKAHDSAYRNVKPSSKGPEDVVALIIKRLQRQETEIEGLRRELRRKSEIDGKKELKGSPLKIEYELEEKRDEVTTMEIDDTSADVKKGGGFK